MPKVKRHHHEWVEDFYSYGGGYWENQPNLPWSEFTTKEKSRHVAKRVIPLALLTGAVVASLSDGPVDFWGDSPHEATREHQIEKISNSAKAIISSLDTEQSFALMYLAPVTLETSGDEGGNGILGEWASSSGDKLFVNIGQNCLQGSAYDTGASYIEGRAVGELSAVASLSVTDNLVQIHPAGSDAPSLKFSKSDSNVLVADDPTSNTLSAYGCEVGMGTYEIVGDYYTPIDIGIDQSKHS